MLICIRKTGVVLLVLFCFNSLTAALLAADPPVKYIGIEHGLSNNVVTCLFQDHKGFMWFGTYDGLNKYDGSSFTVFRNRINDTTSLNGNEIYAITEDAVHNIWIANRNGISIYDPGRRSFSAAYYTHSGDPVKKNISFSVSGIITTKNGNVFAGTDMAGLLLFRSGNPVGRQIPLVDARYKLRSYQVTALEQDAKDGSLWLFVQNVGLCRYGLTDTVVTIVNQHMRQGSCIKTDVAGNLWIGTDNGLFQYNRNADFLSGNYIDGNSKVSSLSIDRKGVLWIASDGKGVLFYDGTTTKAKPFISQDGKPLVNSAAVYSIYEDKQGRKWIGTLRGGINVVEPRPDPFKTIVYKDEKNINPNNNFILSFCEDPEGNIWIGTDGGGLRYWDRSRNTHTVYTHDASNKNTIGSNFVTSIVNDAANNIWVSTWMGGIFRFNRKTKSFEHQACFNPYANEEEKRVWLLYEDKQKTLWASTTNDGTLYRFSKTTNAFEVFDRNIMNVQCMGEDRAGNLWGGNYTSLIKIDRVTKQHKTYDLGHTARCIHEDKKGNFWIGTQGGGLLLFNRETGTYKRFDESSGMQSNIVLRILEDAQGYLWLSSFTGLVRMDTKEFKFRPFSTQDGLQSNQFSFHAAAALRSGEFLFGGIRGFNIFYPDSVSGQSVPPDVFLTDIRIDGKPLESNSPFITESILENVQAIRIPYNRSSLSFNFVALEYDASDKIRYAYFLEGWDKQWNYSNSVHTANYSWLEEGTYYFRIKATDAQGRWGQEAEALKIVVLPPWYRTWWAYLLYFSFTAGCIWLYIRYTASRQRLQYEVKLAHLEKEKEKELNERKLAFFTNVSHEFRTPLTLIINPVKEMVQHSNGNDHELDVVYRNARRLLNLVDQLMLFRKADSGADILTISRMDVIELCNEVFRCFAQQAKVKGIHYRFIAPEAPVELYLDQEKTEIAVFNLLSNAFKFTPQGGHIELEVIDGDNEVLIKVRDNGCGIQAADLTRVFEKFRQADSRKSFHKMGFGIGLYLVKHFVESHKGSVVCESIPDEGSTFTIKLQKGRAHLPADHLFREQEQVQQHELLEELTEDVEPLKIKPVSESKGVTAEETVTGKKAILLIDDNPLIKDYLQQVFAERYLLYTATDSEEGFRIAQRLIPDLIISDINMPGMDGVELCRKIKETENIGHIPVILLTGLTETHVKLKGIESGADDYITKPFDTELLLARVETLLKNRGLLQRYFLDNITLQKTSVKVPAEYQDFLQKCITVIEANLDAEDFTIKQFSKLMGMSHSGLYQKVKSISGQSLNAFIRSIRLRRAAVLMLTENMNVSQAAFQVGIGDVKYFREQFVKLFAMPPSEYIKKYRHSFTRDFNVIRTEEK